MWAMLIGALLTPYLYRFAPLLPYSLFIMLALSYTRFKPSDLHIEPLHYALFVAQWVVALTIYFVLAPLNATLAQGLALITLTPTATSAAVITMMLGGSIAFVTSFLIPCNILIALIAPLLISAINPEMGGTYLENVLAILSQVSALLILPLILIWGLRYLLPKVHDTLSKYVQLTFYVWVVNVAIISANTVHTFMTDETLTLQLGLLYAGASAVLAMMLYYIGQKLGAYYGGQRVNGRQSLGQKNTILAIWIALTFLDPRVAIIPAFYVIWQNVLNSLELAIVSKERREELEHAAVQVEEEEEELAPKSFTDSSEMFPVGKKTI